MTKKKTILICLIIFLVGAGVITITFFTEPEAMRGGATKKTAMLVDVVSVKKGTFKPIIVATGTVRPTQDITLSPRVSGEVISLSSKFIPGGFVKKGEVLFQIDPADYQNQLQQRKSDLQQSLADLNVEMGRQNIAQKDYELIGDSLSADNRSLVLRQPQLNAIKARVEADRAAVKQAQLQLQRTTVRAPFDAHILRRNTNVGSQVAPGDNLGRLVGMDTYWVIVTVPIAKLKWLYFPEEEGEQGAIVKISNRTSWQEGEYREGYVYKLIGALEDQTRMARIIVEVPDPLAYEADSVGVPPLMINAFVETQIQGEGIKDVVKLNRDYLRSNETAWVMEDGKLRVRRLKIVFKDAQYAYVSEGLNDGDRVVTTNLSAVVDGAPLRLEGDKE